jgi:threonine dehydratase
VIRIEEIERAREVIGSEVLRTPLVRLDVPEEAPCEIWLKLECLQPIGSFKIRGALNAIRAAPRGALSTGVVTASAGNMAQGVAWAARDAGVAATIVAPEQAPEAKLRAIERLGARVVEVPFEHWWRALEESRVEGVDGFFVHPFRDPHVMAGNGTIGLEIVERLGEPDAVVVPVGGGGLISGVASALRATSPGTRVIAVEPSTAAPLATSLAAGRPVAIDRRRSFVDGAGGPSILPEMWPLLRVLVDEAVSVTPEETAAAVRLLVERARVVAEGAGALPVAAALAGHAGSGRVVAVVSGGNIDAAVLATILRGETP